MFEAADALHHPEQFFYLVQEDARTGRRRYGFANQDGFFEHYKRCHPKSRHCYELIREGSPCHLYLDLGYQTEFNPGLLGQPLVKRLVLLLVDALRQRWGIVVVPDRDVIELDSSTPAKFSTHLLLRLPGHAFKTNQHAGAFVRQVVEQALQSSAVGQTGQEESPAERQPESQTSGKDVCRTQP